eukprot:scaffold295263_cov24-Prasinocladus_malaysianus.AAC.1
MASTSPQQVVLFLPLFAYLVYNGQRPSNSFSSSGLPSIIDIVCYSFGFLVLTELALTGLKLQKRVGNSE